MSDPIVEKDALRAAGYHVERQGTYDNRMKRLAVLENRLRWAEDEKEHHEKWLSGVLDESRRLQDRFNRITAALAVSGVEWSVIADLLGDDTRVTSPGEPSMCIPGINGCRDDRHVWPCPKNGPVWPSDLPPEVG